MVGRDLMQGRKQSPIHSQTENSTNQLGRKKVLKLQNLTKLLLSFLALQINQKEMKMSLKHWKWLIHLIKKKIVKNMT